MRPNDPVYTLLYYAGINNWNIIKKSHFVFINNYYLGPGQIGNIANFILRIIQNKCKHIKIIN